jgi:hypothetical protein
MVEVKSKMCEGELQVCVPLFCSIAWGVVWFKLDTLIGIFLLSMVRTDCWFKFEICGCISGRISGGILWKIGNLLGVC